MADKTSAPYTVGYKNPPKHTQFQKGRSGNPKGRPKGSKNLKTDLAEELAERIAVRENGQRRTLSKQRAVLKRLTTKALEGDSRATGLLFTLMLKVLDQSDPQEIDLPTEDELEILETFRQRVRQQDNDNKDDDETKEAA